MNPARTHRYQRKDFQPLPARLEHMEIHLNFLDGRVEGSNCLHLQARQPLTSVTLDARDLDLHSVELLGDAAPQPLAYEYRRDQNLLHISLPRGQQPGERFVLRIRCACVPSDNVLEGIYKDTTPAGCPQQYISQCQQWGFQRILPVYDDCTAKCTLTTTLEADARYTHLISNGDVCRRTNPDGRPALKPGDPSRKVITYENRIPMAPYLFLACVGTWDMLEDEIVYPSGRRVRLEYLVPPGRTDGARIPMRILKDSVLWQGRTQEYEYQREVYRTLCMEKSNFGGMENVGNTTIVTSAALVDEFTTDGRLEYAYGVIVHEFEHNQCGSDVTMETPFDMWLNEAFTVDVERQFTRSHFDPVCLRLDQVESMRAPIHGPLAVEDGGHMGQIVREGFNDPDELVDGVTYVKAAEVIHMLRLVLGAEPFRKAKNLYFERHAGGNANTDDFFRCFAETTGRDLAQFRREWLHTIGYPRIRAAHAYDPQTRTLRIRLTQTRAGQGGLFHVPLRLAAVNPDGRDIPGTERTVELTGGEQTLEFRGIEAPAFISFNRDCSFYGTFFDESATPGQLIRQVRGDSDGFNRVEAMRHLTDLERIRLIREPAAAIDPRWLDTYGALLCDRTLPPGLKGYLLRIDEQSMDRDYLPFYRERYAARETLLKAVAGRFLPDLLRVFAETDTYSRGPDPRDGLENRRLKGTLLRAIIAADTPETQALAAEHFHKAWNFSDRITALYCIHISSHPQRRELLAQARAQWKHHINGYSAYLSTLGSGAQADVFDLIAQEEKQPEFRIEHPNHSRGLYLPMATNNKLLWTDTGLEWTAQTAIRLATVNENTTLRLVGCFQLVNRLADDLKPKVLTALRRMHKEIDPAKAPSVAGRIQAYLQTS